MTTTEHDQKIIDRVEQEMLSGRNFRYAEASSKSVPRGGAPISARSYGKVMGALARFAEQGDWHVAAADRAMRKANPYTTPNEVRAQVAAGLAEFVEQGYFDVIGATGPEASRPSAHQHPVTLRQAIILALLLTEVDHAITGLGFVPGIGWCLRDLMERENVTVPAHMFPALAKAEQERAQR